MVKRIFLFFTVFSVVLGVGCFSNSDNSTGSLQIQLSFPSGETRTLLPDIDMTPYEYILTGTGPAGAHYSVTTTEETVFINAIPVGSWTFDIQALNVDGVIIGFGRETASIVEGETTMIEIVVNAIEGVGSLDLAIDWNEGALDSPTIEAQLIPNEGGPISLDFTIGLAGATSVHDNLPTGYYTLILRLLDNGLQVMGIVEIVRIVNGETTSGSFTYVPVTGGGQIDIELAINDPIEVTMSGQVPELPEGTSMTVTALVPPDVGAVAYIWYLDADVIGVGKSITFGSDLPIQRYSLAVTVFTLDGTRAGSASDTVTVVENIQPGLHGLLIPRVVIDDQGNEDRGDDEISYHLGLYDVPTGYRGAESLYQFPALYTQLMDRPRFSISPNNDYISMQTNALLPLGYNVAATVIATFGLDAVEYRGRSQSNFLGDTPEKVKDVVRNAVTFASNNNFYGAHPNWESDQEYYIDVAPAWSPVNKDHLAFSRLSYGLQFDDKISNEENEYVYSRVHICLADEQGNVTDLTGPQDNTWDLIPTWKPDGSELAFFRGDLSANTMDLCIMSDIEGAQDIRCVGGGAPLDFLEYINHPDYKQALRMDWKGNIIALHIPVEIIEVDEEIKAPRCETYLYFVNQSQVVPLTDYVPECEGVDCKSPALNPAGSKLAFSGNQAGVHNIYLFDFTANTVQNITNNTSSENPTINNHFPAWDPGGEYIAYQALSDPVDYSTQVIPGDSEAVSVHASANGPGTYYVKDIWASNMMLYGPITNQPQNRLVASGTPLHRPTFVQRPWNDPMIRLRVRPVPESYTGTSEVDVNLTAEVFTPGPALDLRYSWQISTMDGSPVQQVNSSFEAGTNNVSDWIFNAPQAGKYLAAVTIRCYDTSLSSPILLWEKSRSEEITVIHGRFNPAVSPDGAYLAYFDGHLVLPLDVANLCNFGMNRLIEDAQIDDIDIELMKMFKYIGNGWPVVYRLDGSGAPPERLLVDEAGSQKYVQALFLTGSEWVNRPAGPSLSFIGEMTNVSQGLGTYIVDPETGATEKYPDAKVYYTESPGTTDSNNGFSVSLPSPSIIPQVLDRNTAHPGWIEMYNNDGGTFDLPRRPSYNLVDQRWGKEFSDATESWAHFFSVRYSAIAGEKPGIYSYRLASGMTSGYDIEETTIITPEEGGHMPAVSVDAAREEHLVYISPFDFTSPTPYEANLMYWNNGNSVQLAPGNTGMYMNPLWIKSGSDVIAVRDIEPSLSYPQLVLGIFCQVFVNPDSIPGFVFGNVMSNTSQLCIIRDAKSNPDREVLVADGNIRLWSSVTSMDYIPNEDVIVFTGSDLEGEIPLMIDIFKVPTNGNTVERYLPGW